MVSVKAEVVIIARTARIGRWRKRTIVFEVKTNEEKRYLGSEKMGSYQQSLIFFLR